MHYASSLGWLITGSLDRTVNFVDIEAALRDLPSTQAGLSNPGLEVTEDPRQNSAASISTEMSSASVGTSESGAPLSKLGSFHAMSMEGHNSNESKRAVRHVGRRPSQLSPSPHGASCSDDLLT